MFSSIFDNDKINGMYKTLWIILFVLGALMQAQTDAYISNYPNFVKNQQVYLFGDRVHLRGEPSSNSNSIAILAIGSPLIILEDENQSYSNNNPFWVKVMFEDFIGFVRSDFISLQTVELNGVPIFTQLDKTEDHFILKIRIPTQREPSYHEKTFEVNSTMMQLEVFDSKGLKNISNIIHINYIAEACGVDGGGKYIFIDPSGEWHETFSCVQVADGGIFYWQETLKFPSEHKKGDFIIYTSEYMETEFEGDGYVDPIHTEEHKSERILRWNGSQLIPEFMQEPIPTIEW